MAMYKCEDCNEFIDDDYHPMNEDTLCPSCTEKPEVILSYNAIEVLRNRKGFRRWWDNIGEEQQRDVHDCLHERFLQVTGG